MISILGLPFLAVSLALGRRRSSRFYGIAIGGGILIVYHEILQFGERMVGREVEPLLVLWLPLAIFLGISGFLFYRTAFFAGEPSAIRAIEGVINRLAELFGRYRMSRAQDR